MSDNRKKQKRRLDFKTLFNDDRFLKIASAVAAIVLWLSISLGKDNTISTTIHNVPIDTSAISNSVESIGMEIVDGLGQTISVKVEGRREVVGNLTAADIKVTPQIVDSITNPGTYSLRLNATKANNLDIYEIVSIAPERVNLTFDRVQSKRLTVEIDISSVSAADKDLILGEPSCNVSEIAIKGAQNIVDSVDSIVIRVEQGGKISKSTTFAGKLYYYDAAGKQLDVGNDILADVDDISVVVPVLKAKKVELRVGFTNVPVYLNTDFIRYSLSTASVEVAGPIDVIDTIENITVGYLDLTKARIGDDVVFNVELPAGFVMRSDVQQVTMKLENTYYSARAFNITEFKVNGVPGDYTATVVDTAVNGVSIMGLTSDVVSLKAEEISMEVDISSLVAEGNITPGERKVHANVVVSSGKTVWATGSYTVTINVEKNQ